MQRYLTVEEVQIVLSMGTYNNVLEVHTGYLGVLEEQLQNEKIRQLLHDVGQILTLDGMGLDRPAARRAMKQFDALAKENEDLSDLHPYWESHMKALGDLMQINAVSQAMLDLGIMYHKMARINEWEYNDSNWTSISFALNKMVWRKKTKREKEAA